MKTEPIHAGRCLFHMEAMWTKSTVSRGYQPYAGVRVMQPSIGGEESHYAPASDVYLFLTADDAQRLSAYFSKLARLMQEIE